MGDETRKKETQCSLQGEGSPGSGEREGDSDVVGNLVLEAVVSASYALVGYVGFVFVERQLKLRGTMDQQDI